MATPTTSDRPGAAASSSRAAPALIEEDLDDPTSAPSASNPTHNNADDSADEDEAPDYLRLLSSLQPKSKSSTSSSGIIIPKRGEKDFEPTGFGGQSKLLDRSREAMFQAVSGERRVGSRSLVKATWSKGRRRAKLHDVQGKIFETVGVIHRQQVVDNETGKARVVANNELLPEEALFLAERGSLQIYAEGGEPMSLQQAFTELLLPTNGEKGKVEDEPLTREAYLIYAYLKRLGYVVQRARVVDAVRAAPVSASALAKKTAPFSQNLAKAEGIIADPQRPLRLVTILDVLLYVPRRIAQLGGDAARAVVRWVQAAWRRTVAKWITIIASAATKAIGSRKGATGSAGSLGLGLGLGKREDGRRFLGEKGNVEWDSYDAVFRSMQIVPSGHDFWLPSSTSSTPTPEEATSTVKLAPPTKPVDESEGLKPYYYAYRPATLYRKSHPPPPEFRIVILNARTTPLPSVWEFERIFAQIPIPGSDQELFSSLAPTDGEGEGMTEDQVKARVEYEKQLKQSNDAKNRAAYGKFSDGKQKFLREKAEARKAAFTERAERANAVRQSTILGRFMGSVLGRVLMKVMLMDFALLRLVGRLFRHCPGCYSDKGRNGNARGGARGKGRNNAGGGKGAGGGGGNVFPPLKAGRRSVVVAVVDGSITTLLRFGESEFAQWKLFGSKPQPKEESEEKEQEKDSVHQATASL